MLDEVTQVIAQIPYRASRQWEGRIAWPKAILAKQSAQGIERIALSVLGSLSGEESQAVAAARQHKKGSYADEGVAPQILRVHAAVEEEAEGTSVEQCENISRICRNGDFIYETVATHFWLPSLVGDMLCVKHLPMFQLSFHPPAIARGAGSGSPVVRDVNGNSAAAVAKRLEIPTKGSESLTQVPRSFVASREALDSPAVLVIQTRLVFEIDSHHCGSPGEAESVAVNGEWFFCGMVPGSAMACLINAIDQKGDTGT